MRWAWVTCLAPGLAMAEPIDAVVEWVQQVELGVAVSGVIQSVSVEAGDRVAAGQELLQLDPTPLQADLDHAQAAAERARAEFEEEERALARSQELYDRGVLATVELDQAKLKHVQAKSGLAAAQAAVTLARYRLEQSRLRAPFDAWVIRRNAAPGQTVASELQPPVLVVLGEAGRYLARAQLAPDRAALLRRGQSLGVTVADRRFTGRVKAIGLERGEGGAVSVDVEFTADESLQIGAAARVDLP